MTFSRLMPRFFCRPPGDLARALLGCALVCGERAGIIVETEAYLDGEDLASHARFGKTARNAVMFGRGGTAYVYLCYGLHQLFNVVAGEAGQPGAVLVRALAPAKNLGDDPRVASGPGKLTRALGITRTAHNGVDLARDPGLYIAAAKAPMAGVWVGPRVGVAYAGRWAEAPLRFCVADHPAVSGPRRRRAG
ncbi:MAG TPA: DNA-3-methyladenine glycosylase [Kofleriaceae bacterium]|nr:DNA-3-methyladenine glycosylase [Kofleriaceae bacterium]